MKKIIVFVAILFFISNAYAAAQCGISCPSSWTTSSNLGWEGCETYADYSNPTICESRDGSSYFAIFECLKCKTGYKREIVGYVSPYTNCFYSSYYGCTEICNGCTNCVSDVNWSAGGTGYEKKTTKSCSCNTCNSTTAYRCAAGYYGASTNGTSGCTRCPDSNSTSVTGSNSAITNCYIPNNKAVTESSGTYTFTSDCYYTN